MHTCYRFAIPSAQLPQDAQVWPTSSPDATPWLRSVKWRPFMCHTRGGPSWWPLWTHLVGRRPPVAGPRGAHGQATSSPWGAASAASTLQSVDLARHRPTHTRGVQQHARPLPCRDLNCYARSCATRPLPRRATRRSPGGAVSRSRPCSPPAQPAALFERPRLRSRAPQDARGSLGAAQACEVQGAAGQAVARRPVRLG